MADTEAPAAEQPKQPPAPPAGPTVTVHRQGEQVVVSGTGFDASEALTVSVEQDYQTDSTDLNAAAGAFTFYGRAPLNVTPQVSVRRADGGKVTAD